MREYFKLKTFDSAVSEAQKRFLVSSDDRLIRRERALSIMQKKRDLGLPLNSEDYQNVGRGQTDTFFKHATGVGAKHGLKSLAPKHVPFSQAPEPLFDVAKSLSTGLLSIGKSIPTMRGGRYATIARGIRYATG